MPDKQAVDNSTKNNNDNDLNLSEEEAFKQAKLLWNKYFLLTQELLKFIDKQDIDTFVDIVSQRDRLIEKMKSLPKNDFRETDECKNLIENIKPLDMQIMYKARTWLNKSRRQNSAVKSYDLTGVAGNLGTSGRIFNRKY